MTIDRKRWKSSDDKKPAWNRAKVSIGVAGWLLNLITVPGPTIVPAPVVVPLQGAQKWGKVRVAYSGPCTLKIKHFGWPWVATGFFFCLHTLAWLNLCYRQIKDYSRLEALGILGWVFMPELLIKSTYVQDSNHSPPQIRYIHNAYICTYISGGCLLNSPTDRLTR